MARTLSQKLKILRKSKRLTLRQLAVRAKIDKGQLSRYENGTAKPSYESLRSLAAALEVRVGYLTGEIPELEELTPRQVATWESLRLFLEGSKTRDQVGVALYRRSLALAIAPTSVRSWEEVDEAAHLLSELREYRR